MPRTKFRLSHAIYLATLFLSGNSFAGMVDYFTDNGYGNPVSVLQHPCAEFYGGTTYIAYQGPHEDPYVCAYNHDTSKWSGPVQAGVNTMGRSPDQTDPRMLDNHGRPALIVDAKGYIHLVFGGHGGDFKLGINSRGTPGKGRQTHVVSKNPGDISSWESLDNIPVFGTYSQFVKLDNGDIYLFYRHGSHRSDWVYQKSVDNARTFAPPVSILRHKVSEGDPNVHDAWYAWFDKGKGDTITASYVYHPCRVTGHTKERSNAYFMRMKCANGSWENVRGEALTLPVTKESADTHTLVINTGAERSNHGTCRVDAEGNPHLFFRQGAGQVRYYRWLGDAWQKPVAVAGEPGSQDGDLLVESPQSVRMLVTRRVAAGGEVCWWGSQNGGIDWTKGTCLISSPDSGFDVTALVRNGSPDARVVVAERKGDQEHLFHRLLLLGDKGPVGRPEEETHNLGNRMENLDTTHKAVKPGKEGKRKHKAEGNEDDE